MSLAPIALPHMSHQIGNSASVSSPGRSNLPKRLRNEHEGTIFRCAECERRVTEPTLPLAEKNDPELKLNPAWTCGECEDTMLCIICLKEAAEFVPDRLEELYPLEYLKTFYCVKHYNMRIDQYKIKK